MNTLEIPMEVSEENDIEMEVGETTTTEGTDDYNHLQNKPQINGVTLIGNKNGNNLGLINSDDELAMQTIDNFFETVFGG